MSAPERTPVLTISLKEKVAIMSLLTQIFNQAYHDYPQPNPEMILTREEFEELLNKLNKLEIEKILIDRSGAGL